MRYFCIILTYRDQDQAQIEFGISTIFAFFETNVLSVVLYRWMYFHLTELYKLISNLIKLWFGNLMARNHRDFLASTFKLF